MENGFDKSVRNLELHFKSSAIGCRVFENHMKIRPVRVYLLCIKVAAHIITLEPQCNKVSKLFSNRLESVRDLRKNVNWAATDNLQNK